MQQRFVISSSSFSHFSSYFFLSFLFSFPEGLREGLALAEKRAQAAEVPRTLLFALKCCLIID